MHESASFMTCTTLRSVRVRKGLVLLLGTGLTLLSVKPSSARAQEEPVQAPPPMAAPLALAARVPSEAVAMIAWVNGDSAVLQTSLGQEVRQQVRQWLSDSATSATWSELAARLKLTPDELADIVLNRRVLLVEAPRSIDEGPPQPSFADLMPLLPPSIDIFDQTTIADRFQRWVVGFEADAAMAERIIGAYQCRVFKFIDECPVYLGAEGDLRLGLCGDWIFFSGVKGEAMLQSMMSHEITSPLIDTPEFHAASDLGGNGFLGCFRRESHRGGGRSHRLVLASLAPEGIDVRFLTYDSRDQGGEVPLIPPSTHPALDALAPHGWFVSLEAMDFSTQWGTRRRALFFNPFMQLLGSLRTIADDLDPVMLTIIGDPGFHTAKTEADDRQPCWPSLGIALHVRRPREVASKLDEYVLTLIEGWRMFASGDRDVVITPAIPDDPMMPRGADTSQILPPWMTGPSSPKSEDVGMYWGFVEAPVDARDASQWWVVANAKASFETMCEAIRRHGPALAAAAPMPAAEGLLSGRRWGEATMLWKSLPEPENDWGFRERMLSWGDFLHNLPLIHWTIRPVQGPAPDDDPTHTHYVSTDLHLHWETADPAQ